MTAALTFLQGGGEMGKLTRTYDWSKTSLGTPDTWPQSLRTTLSIVLNSRFPMFLFWGPELICFYNDAYRPSLGDGDKHPSTLGRPGADVWPEIWHIIGPMIDQVLAGDEATWLEDSPGAFYRNGQLETGYWTFSYSPVRDESGQVAGVFVTCMETTKAVENTAKLRQTNLELKQSLTDNEQLRQQEQDTQHQLLALFEQSPVAIAIVGGENLTYRMANQFYAQLVERPLDELIGRRLLDVLPELAEQGFDTLLRQVIRTGEPYVASDMPVRLRRKSGRETLYVNLTYQPQREADGHISSVFVVVIDVTQQVLARKRLEASEARFRNLVTATPAATAVYVGRDMLIEQVNDPMLAIWGKDASVVGKTLHQAIPELEGQPFLAQLQHVFDTGELFRHTEGMADLIENGQPKRAWFNHAYNPLYDENGRTYGVINTAIDVTPQVLTRQELAQREAQLQTIIDSVPIPIGLFIGPDLILSTVNQPFIDVVGKGPDIAGKPLATVMPELNDQPFINLINNVYSSQQPFHGVAMPVRIIRQGLPNDEFHNVSYIPLLNEQQQTYAVLGISLDVTQQVKDRQTIQTSEQQKTFLLQLTDRLRSLTDPADVYYQAAHLLGAHLGANRVGYAEDQGDDETIVVMRTYTRDVPDIAGTYRYADYGPLLAQFLTGTTVVRPDIANDPSLTDAEKEAHRLIQLGATVNKPLLRLGQPMIVLFMHYQQAHIWSADELTLLDEVAERIVLAVERAEAEQALRESEQRYRVLSEELDVRVNVRTHELEIANQDLQRSNDNLQQFAYVASHDLQEPLRKIHSFSTLLAEQNAGQLDEFGLDILRRMQVAGERMSTLIRDLLAYSRIATRQQVFGPVSLAAILDGVLETLDWQIEQTNAQLSVDELPVVNGDEPQLSQLFQNLLSNALKFIPAGRSPQVQVRYAKRQPDELPAEVYPSRPAPFYHQISVKDNGVGFDNKYLDRIFQVFQRLHNRNEFPGTGVGLAICQRVVENHGGAITADSQPGEGTTFCVYLPT